MATKKRLIDANEAYEAVIDLSGQADTKSAYAAFWKAGKEIQKLPTVDSVEVVHAHWVEWWPGDCALIMTGEEMLHQCSSCSAKYSDVEGFRYCPHCGAFMDGGSTDES